MLLNNRLNQIQSQIDAYLEQIAKLQANVTQLQTHAQEVQTVEQAAESALSQISAALSMLQAVCPDEIATFKAAVDAKFREPVFELAAALDDIETPVDPKPVAPTPEPDTETEVTTVEASAVTVEESEETALTRSESATTDTEITGSATNRNGNGNGHRLLTYDELKKLDKRTLADLMTSQLIAQGKYKNGDKDLIAKSKKDNLLTHLDGTVTVAELEAVQQA